MKLASFISLLVLFASLILLPSCSNDAEEEELTEPCHERIFPENPITQELNCDPGLSFPLIIEGTSQVGTVRIVPQDNAFKVSYITTGDWVLHKVSLFAGRPQDLRTTHSCTPILDPLSYTSSPQTPANSYGIAFYVNSVEDCFYFITSAEVSNPQDPTSEIELAIANTGNRLIGNHNGWYGVLCKSSCLSEIPVPLDCPVFP